MLLAGVSTLEYSKESNQEIRPFKTLWDWMQLLFIPLVLVVGGYFLNRSEKSREIKAAKERANLDREIAKIRNEEIALSEYINRMSELIITNNILTLKHAKLRNVARTRTIAILNRLTEKRITIVINFLKESCLISSKSQNLDNEIVDLKNAELSSFDLSKANLSLVILEGANLREANLTGANLR